MKISQKIQAIIALTAMSTTLAFANTTETASGSTETKTATASGATVETKAAATSATAESSLVLSEVKVETQDSLILTFNNDLVTDTEVFEFTVADEANTEVKIAKKELVDSKNLKLTMETPLTLWAKYSLVVLFAADVSSATIEDGVGGTAEFSVPETFEEVAMDAAAPTAEAAPTTEVKAAPTAEECAANPDSEECKVAFGETTVPEAEKLPDTGAKETVLILMAILAASGVMFIKRKA